MLQLLVNNVMMMQIGILYIHMQSWSTMYTKNYPEQWQKAFFIQKQCEGHVLRGQKNTKQRALSIHSPQLNDSIHPDDNTIVYYSNPHNNA